MLTLGHCRAALVAALVYGGSALAQPGPVTLPSPKAVPAPPAPACAESGFTPQLPTLPQKGRTGAELSAFVDNLNKNDAAIEVIVGQGRVLTLKKDLAEAGKPRPLIAVGDPAVIDFVVVSPRQIRVIGQRMGRTDLSITTSDGQTFSFEVQVIADLDVLRAQLKAVFPDADLKIAQMRDHVVVGGEARDTAQVTRILEMVRAYLLSLQASQVRKTSGGGQPPPQAAPPRPDGVAPGREPVAPVVHVFPEAGITVAEGAQADPRIINMIHVPGPQQVLLKVRVAELNRTSLRAIGADFIGVDRSSGSIFGTQIAGGSVSAVGTFTDAGVAGLATAAVNPTTTVFGIFEGANMEILVRALRQNSVLKILAEPNLVTLHGHPATFLAGGEFPIPVPQVSSGGFASTITVQFKEFGVRLGFVPYILDGDMIRLSVDPEVSTIDFALGTTLVPGGSPVPGLNTRRSHATVELRQGQTLAIAGLLQVQLDGTTTRIPGLGDLPVIGALFSGTTSQRQEKELVVLVTPYLVEPMNPGQVPPSPGDDVGTPTDCEFYFLHRIEGRKGVDFRSTLSWDDPLCLRQCLNLEKKNIHGPCGFSE